VYVVAPSESDHQLKYVESSGLVDFVLIDDTDAVVLGCAKVVHKVSWIVSTLKCNVFNRNNLRMPVDTNEVNTVVELTCMHGDAAVRLRAGVITGRGKFPDLDPKRL
jgi:5'-3' exonuclease